MPRSNATTASAPAAVAAVPGSMRSSSSASHDSSASRRRGAGPPAQRRRQAISSAVRSHGPPSFRTACDPSARRTARTEASSPPGSSRTEFEPPALGQLGLEARKLQEPCPCLRPDETGDGGPERRLDDLAHCAHASWSRENGVTTALQLVDAALGQARPPRVEVAGDGRAVRSRDACGVARRSPRCGAGRDPRRTDRARAGAPGGGRS